MIIEQLKNFFERPGINKTGLLKEAEISPQLINAILRRDNTLTEKTMVKLFPILISYGYKEKKEVIKFLVFQAIEDYKKSESNFKIVQAKLSTLNLIFESMKDYDNSLFIVGHIINKAVKEKNKEAFEANLKDLELNFREN